ncbi:hypothetical protein J7T55_006511 [Diaporthe amygdali]|uniref:uncharacterized protein n=1 Tax=Phomopsis amygdali TaxID=1214568 RepID=UPI0022FED849|nr:uncharacterized protein J7T55_006511 [Diaporthe amygdali]KAJ0125167.1 hypothetical protein J7T55_006511 [Diaporthe amygdali]
MASDKIVDVGSFSIASNIDMNFALTVSTSMSLALPEHFPENLTATDLRDKVQAGALWITRAGSCRLTLAVHFEDPADMFVHGHAQRKQIAIEAFQSFQQSGLFVPRDVPCGYLSEFSCSFRFAARTSTAPGNVEESLPRSRSHAHYGLRKLAETPSKPRSETTAAFWSLAPNVQAERVTHLTHHALNLVLGMKKRSPGIRYLKRTKPPALLELAPGVWNAQYFQNVVTRAQLVPAISSALANLTSTQSPVLRRKIVSLLPESAAETEPVSDELHRRTLVLLLQATRDQKTKIRIPRVENRSAHGLGLLLSEEDHPGPNESTCNELSEDASLDPVRGASQSLVRGHSHECMTDLSDYEPKYLESESRYCFLPYVTSNGQSGGIITAPEGDDIENDTNSVGSMHDDAVACTAEWHSHDPALEHNGPYAEDEDLSLPYNEEEYHDLYVAPVDVQSEYFMNQADFYHESGSYSHYYEMPTVEGEVQTTARVFEYYSAGPDEAIGTFDGAVRGDPGNDYSEPEGEDLIIGDNIYQHHDDDGMNFLEDDIDVWQTDNDRGRGGLLIANDGHIDLINGDDIDSEDGANYVAGRHVFHNGPVEEAEGDVGLGSCEHLLEDWRQVPRHYTYNDTENHWMGLEQHPIRYRLQ